ncbi:MAG TPA: flavodoxin family protein [Candidatus Acidoferrum sp.]|jgi:multimeric flavodoxin WrbA|nr:flavodoxin family protein [Candidatus Acidoferrum sp.]
MTDMKVCGLVGSPKKKGNVDLLVSQVLKGAKSEGAETRKIYINDLSIKPCQSCGTDPYPKHCFFDDDMKLVYDALESCDAIVLGSPVYFDTVSAQTKLVIDRINCLMPYVKRSDGSFGFERRMKKRKKGVFVAVAGVSQEFTTILTTIKGFINWANIELVDTILYSHDDNEVGGVKSNKERMSCAFDVGIRIARKNESPKSSAENKGRK